ncbi:MAG: hypothetical protein U9Q76_05050, partial [candidate division WOR-3 bacterium]|nr:hypothetical protein [candidate division WOR-3 bacterium]
MKKWVLVSLVLIVTSTAYAQFDSLNMRFVGNWPFGPSYAVAHDSARNLVFLGSGGGVYILDASNSEEPVKISDEIRTRDVVNGLFYDTTSQALYIAAGEAGLEIWNVSDPFLPVKRGWRDTPGYANNVFVSGSYAYVADGPAGLRVIRIYQTSPPREIGYYDTPGYAKDVYVSDSCAYVADVDSGLRVIDVSKPWIPKEIGHWVTQENANGVSVSGSYAYVGCGERWADIGYLRVIDISIPSDPEEVSHCCFRDPRGTRAERVYVSGSYAYVICGRGSPTFGCGLYVVDISVPSSPRRVGSYAPYLVEDVCVSGHYAYVARLAGGTP